MTGTRLSYIYKVLVNNNDLPFMPIENIMWIISNYNILNGIFIESVICEK